jgi:hypothetical protein
MVFRGFVTEGDVGKEEKKLWTLLRRYHTFMHCNVHFLLSKSLTATISVMALGDLNKLPSRGIANYRSNLDCVPESVMLCNLLFSAETDPEIFRILRFSLSSRNADNKGLAVDRTNQHN